VSKVFSFLKRDFRIDVSYRFSFVFQVAWIFLSTSSYFFLSRFIEPSMQAQGIEARGGSYFAFVLIGIALSDYHSSSVTEFSRNIRESQLTGTLETLLTTQTPLPVVILCSLIYPFLWSFLRLVLYLGVGALLFHLPLGAANWAATSLMLLLSILVFGSFGILSAALIMIFKRMSPLPFLLEGLAWLVGGVLYPITVLPPWLKTVSSLLPITYSIEGLRAALLEGSSWSTIWLSLGPLLVFGAVLLPLSLVLFSFATRKVRDWGTLAQY
jgi:ABC-2 type transport system permease protein